MVKTRGCSAADASCPAVGAGLRRHDVRGEALRVCSVPVIRDDGFARISPRSFGVDDEHTFTLVLRIAEVAAQSWSSLSYFIFPLAPCGLSSLVKESKVCTQRVTPIGFIGRGLFESFRKVLMFLFESDASPDHDRFITLRKYCFGTCHVCKYANVSCMSV